MSRPSPRPLSGLTFRHWVNPVTPTALIGCGFLFLLEASIGLFWPEVYQLVVAAPGSRPPLRLRLVGGGLLLCGIAFLAVGIPPSEPARWVLVVAGAAMIFKGTVMLVFPGSLKDNPTTISANPSRWKVKCGMRLTIGLALVIWGIVRGWPAS